MNNCTSSPATINVAVNPTPAMPSVTSNSPFCAGSTINLTAATAGSSITYAWTGPNGFTSNLQNPVIDNAVTAQNGTYSVTASAVNCPSSPAAVDVVIYPALTNQIDNSQKTICSSQTVAIAGETPVGGNANAYSFQWQQSTDNVIWTDLVGETVCRLLFLRRAMYM